MAKKIQEITTIDDDLQLPDAPAHLDRIAKQTWKRLGPMLLQTCTVTEGDWFALAALCAEWSVYLEADKVLKAEGYYTSAASGYKNVHPMVSVKNQALATALRIASQYGLTPAARIRMKAPVTGTEEIDPFLD